MESRIKGLLEKYWAGETSIQEETELKEHFRENPSLTSEGSYFRELNRLKADPEVKFTHPGRAGRKARWSVAAVVTIGLMAAVLVIQDARKQSEFAVEDPKEAFEITRKALLMVSSGLNEGKTYSTEINNLNKAEELIREN
ncbi:hypothetical protein [Marinoscillum sp. 108]|jgi:hypothetical protein|uniref:Uncharacterized protein n=1 Tax=Marinoscillum luteum TaxID=861051 RepID=A0ABW7N9Q0_9BACT|nr:hypothetical protein [Marinoscillum sp. 108]VXD17017.1 conserved hypothetical protein [Marinoscillum sp. 108]